MLLSLGQENVMLERAGDTHSSQQGSTGNSELAKTEGFNNERAT